MFTIICIILAGLVWLIGAVFTFFVSSVFNCVVNRLWDTWLEASFRVVLAIVWPFLSLGIVWEELVGLVRRMSQRTKDIAALVCCFIGFASAGAPLVIRHVHIAPPAAAISYAWTDDAVTSEVDSNRVNRIVDECLRRGLAKFICRVDPVACRTPASLARAIAVWEYESTPRHPKF